MMALLVAALVLIGVVVYVLWAASDVVRDEETLGAYAPMLAATALVTLLPLAWAIAVAT